MKYIIFNILIKQFTCLMKIFCQGPRPIAAYTIYNDRLGLGEGAKPQERKSNKPMFVDIQNGQWSTQTSVPDMIGHVALWQSNVVKKVNTS